MTRFHQAQAREMLAGLALGPLNRELADLWLSLWDGDALPARCDINPSRMVRFLPGLAIMDLHVDDSVRFRIAGKSFRPAFGFDPSGRDMLALTPERERALRLARCKSIVSGVVGTGIRVARMEGLPEMIAQDIVLPLGGVNEDGSRSWMFHTAWRPGTVAWQGPLPANTLGMAREYIERALA